MNSPNTRQKMTMWGGAAISAALVLSGCGQAAPSAPVETAASKSTTPSPVTAASSTPSDSGTPESASASPTKRYSKTEEYSQLKMAMLSFKQLKDIAPAGPEAAVGGQCTGATYTYELGNSGLTCDEAKTFLTSLLKEPIQTSAVEVSGVGACLLPGPTQAGYCNFDSTGGTFEFSMKYPSQNAAQKHPVVNLTGWCWRRWVHELVTYPGIARDGQVDQAETVRDGGPVHSNCARPKP